MKKLLVLSITSVFLVSYYSCTKDKTPEPVPCNETDTVNTYLNSVKAILDSRCSGGACHSGAGAGGVILDTYSSAVNAAKKDAKFFCSIDWTCEPHMPQGYSAPINSTEIDAIKKWRDNCYAEGKIQQPIVCNPTDTINTYFKSAKAILDGYCLGSGCHGGAGSAGVILDSYTSSVSAAKTNAKFFCSIDWTCTPHMPQGYHAPIDTSEINALLRWRDNCYAQ